MCKNGTTKKPDVAHPLSMDSSKVVKTQNVKTHFGLEGAWINICYNPAIWFRVIAFSLATIS